MGERSASLENEWTFGPDVPTNDFLQHRDVHSDSDLEWLVSDLIHALERGDFLRWEAVVCRELGLPLTERERQAIGELLDFNDDPDEGRILYIDGIPRPDRLWYEVVRLIAPHLLVEHYKDRRGPLRRDYRRLEGPGRRTGAARRRSVAARGDQTPHRGRARRGEAQAVAPDLPRPFGRAGQNEDLTLQDPDEHYRIEEFIACLRSTRRASRPST